MKTQHYLSILFLTLIFACTNESQKSIMLDTTEDRDGVSFSIMPMAHEENRESYNLNEVSGFFSPNTSPFSTFAMDVDRGSYNNVKRMITDGYDVPPDAVRTEEFVNAFRYSYPNPTEDQTFSFYTEMSQCPWNEKHLLLRIGLNTREIERESLKPVNLVYLVDRSGSMNSEDKLGLMKKSFRLLVEQLRPEDHISIVTYASGVEVVLEPTSGDEKEAILAAVDGMTAGGSTNGSGGIQLAYEQAMEEFDEEGENRVVLCTDGDFNVGVSDQSELIRMIEEKRESGVNLSVFGFGSWNLQEGTMEQLANHGNGNFNYIGNMFDANKAFVEEFGATMFTLAKDAKVQVEFNPQRVQNYRLLGYENRVMADEDFRNDKVDGGEIGPGHQVTMLYEIIPGTSEPSELRYQQQSNAGNLQEVATIAIRYKNPETETVTEESYAIPFQITEPSSDQNFAAGVASFAGVLRNDSLMTIDAATIESLVRAGRENDPTGERANFQQLVQVGID